MVKRNKKKPLCLNLSVTTTWKQVVEKQVQMNDLRQVWMWI